MASPDHERLMVYGFSFEYPRECRLEFNPKFNREEGDVALKWPQNFNVFVSWGPLERLLKKSTTIEEHADFSLQKISKSVQGRVSSLERREIETQGHRSLFNHVRVEIPRRGFIRGKPQYQEIRSLHLHCDRTSRYFVIYGSTEPEKSPSHGETVTRVIDSFTCH